MNNEHENQGLCSGGRPNLTEDIRKGFENLNKEIEKNELKMEYIPLLPPKKGSPDSEFWFKWLLNNISFIGCYINSHAPDVSVLTKPEKQEYFSKLIDLKNAVNGTITILTKDSINETITKENQNEL